MTEPAVEYRSVAGLLVPLPLVPRIVEAMYARYPEATAGITDPDAAVRAALRAWVVETLADYEEAKAKAPLPVAVAQTVTSFEAKAREAREKAETDSTEIVEDPALAEPPPASSA